MHPAGWHNTLCTEMVRGVPTVLDQDSLSNVTVHPMVPQRPLRGFIRKTSRGQKRLILPMHQLRQGRASHHRDEKAHESETTLKSRVSYLLATYSQATMAMYSESQDSALCKSLTTVTQSSGLKICSTPLHYYQAPSAAELPEDSSSRL